MIQPVTINYRLVNQNNVLWTCKKACKIEFGDCVYCICSSCYDLKSSDVNNTNPNNGQQVRKRRRSARCNDDDDLTICRHHINSLEPFMDQSFFTQKYKDTIKGEKYVLPMFCSECDSELVDKIPSIMVASKENVISF